jgi:DNA polymerase (family 10)
VLGRERAREGGVDLGHEDRRADGGSGREDPPEHRVCDVGTLALRELEPPLRGCGAEGDDDGRHDVDTSGVTTRRDPPNAEIAGKLDSFATLLELAGANSYSVRAYRRAADVMRESAVPVAELVRTGRIRQVRGIGPGIEARLRELVETGELHELQELEEQISPDLVGVGRLLGLSAKRTIDIGQALGVRTVDELREAAAQGRLREVPGIGPKTEEKLRAALAQDLSRPPAHALLLNRALALTNEIAFGLDAAPTGDARRFRDRCEHLAVVAPAEDPAETIRRFEALPQIVALVESEDRRAVGVTVEGVPVELRVPPPGRLGTDLIRATGAPAYVEALEPLPDGRDELEVYGALGIPWCPPELREAPFRDQPPPLVELEDIRGDLHCHTTWSDGRGTVEEMGRAAIERGYAYLAICDHTKAVSVVPGLDADDLRLQAEEIAAANERLAPFRILRGIECDIRADGTLDLPDDVLAELDWVMASVHAGQRGSRAELTKRTVEAMYHPSVSAISHPTGRLIDRRPPNALDLDTAFQVALETGTALETNGLPDRLDLKDEHVRQAVEAGIPIVVATDAHSTRGLGNIVLALGTARRGRATAADVVNARPLEEILASRKPGLLRR